MDLKELLSKIKCLPRNTKVYIHEVDENGRVSFKPLKGINLNVSDKILSFGTRDFNEMELELLKKKGFFCRQP